MKEVDLVKELADRIDDMRDVDVACRNLVQQGCKQEEVFTVDQSCFGVGNVREGALKFQGRVQPAKSCSQNNDSVSQPDAHEQSHLRWRLPISLSSVRPFGEPVRVLTSVEVLFALLPLHLLPVIVRLPVVRHRILRKHHVGLLVALKEKLALVN